MAISPDSAFWLLIALVVSACVAIAVLGIAILGHIIVFVWNHLAITAGIIIFIFLGIYFIFKKC